MRWLWPVARQPAETPKRYCWRYLHIYCADLWILVMVVWSLGVYLPSEETADYDSDNKIYCSPCPNNSATDKHYHIWLIIVKFNIIVKLNLVFYNYSAHKSVVLYLNSNSDILCKVVCRLCPAWPSTPSRLAQCQHGFSTLSCFHRFSLSCYCQSLCLSGVFSQLWQGITGQHSDGSWNVQ